MIHSHVDVWTLPFARTSTTPTLLTMHGFTPRKALRWPWRSPAGTPVIALRRGSVPEIIVDGVTGFICQDIDEMVEAVGRVDELDPSACRRHAATFDATAMCIGYERVYETIWAETGLNRLNNLAETR